MVAATVSGTGVHAANLVVEGDGARVTLEVAEAEAVVMHGQPSVRFLLTEQSGEVFTELTGAMIGEELTVSLCDRELVRAVVRERLSGRGIVNLPDIEGAVAVADVMRGEAECDTLAPHFPD